MKFYDLTLRTIATGLLLTACSDDDSSADSGAGTAGSGSSSSGPGGNDAPADDDGGSVGVDDSTTATPGTGGSSSGGPDDGSDSGSGGSGSGSDSGGSDDSGSGSSSGGVVGTSTTDDGGEEESTDDGNQELCEAPGNLVTCDEYDDDPTVFEAIGLNCTGGPDEVIPILGEGFNSVDAQSWRVARQFGTANDPVTGDPIWSPREGDTMLFLSSGNIAAANAAGVVLQTALNDDDSTNPSNKPLPAPMSPQTGSGGAAFTNCDGIHDCSDSLITQWNAGGGAANDLIWFQFSAAVPAGTHGFAIDFAYFSEEFPEWVGTVFNDMFVVWSNSETYTGNLCFIDDQPCTVTALWPTQYQAGNPMLVQTGYTPDAATGWFQIKGSAEPLELLQLSFAVFDMGDQAFDTMVLLDHFAWDCEGCTPSEVNPCGVIDPV
jgi:hypothetical protein